jgi:hypothetical protein
MTLTHQIILNSFICYGVFYATRYEWSVIENKEVRNEALGFIKKYGDQVLPLWIRKPLYDCPMCMGSFWSVVTSLYFGLEVLADIIPIILATCGLNYIIHKLSPYND